MLSNRFFLTQKSLLHTSSVCRSYIGKMPVLLTPETSVSIEKLSEPIKRKLPYEKIMLFQNKVKVVGPKGELSLEVPDFMKIEQNAEKTNFTVSVHDSSIPVQRSMWGTVRSILKNNVIGVNEGHLAMLKFVGTGYRCQILEKDNYISIKVGNSVKQGIEIPAGLTVTSPTPTFLIVEGIDLQKVNSFAMNIRKFHPPEPYKGKGIYVNDEKIKLKVKKVK
ncbi:hypothetical protein ACO0RG_002209 [Hanseniaspora osmophila]